MNTFTKISRSSRIINPITGQVAEVFKYKKEGSKRVYFAAEVDGKRLNPIMYAKLWESEKFAKLFLNRKMN